MPKMIHMRTHDDDLVAIPTSPHETRDVGRLEHDALDLGS